MLALRARAAAVVLRAARGALHLAPPAAAPVVQRLAVEVVNLDRPCSPFELEQLQLSCELLVVRCFWRTTPLPWCSGLWHCVLAPPLPGVVLCHFVLGTGCVTHLVQAVLMQWPL